LCRVGARGRPRPQSHQIASSFSGSKKWSRSRSIATRRGCPVRAALRGLRRAVSMTPESPAVSASGG